jgi:hypothetical protein
MADVSDTSAFDAALLANNSANFGPTAITNQSNTAAQTQYTQARTQGQNIQNASDALNLQALQIGLSQLYKMPGFQPDQSSAPSGGGASSYQSGAAMQSRGATSRTAPVLNGAAPAQTGGVSSAAPASSGGSGAPSAQGGQPDPSTPVDQTDDEIGQSVSHPETLDSNLRRDYTVNPLGTPQEMQNIMAAARVSALTKNPAYVQIATQQRDMGVAQRRFQAQQEASRHYDVLSAVADAGDDGNAFKVLEQVAPESARKILKLHPDATPEELNEIAADTAAHFAGHIHQYTGREVEKREDGTYVDSQTKFPVAGVRGSGLSPEQYGKAVDAANAPVTIKNSDGTETQMPTWEYAKSQGTPVTSAADYVKQKADQQQAIAQHRQMVQDHLTAQRTQQQIAQSQQPPQFGQPQQPAAQPGQQPGQQPQPKDNGLLPGINPDALPKFQMAPVKQGTSQSPADLKTSEGIATARLEQMKAANDGYVDAQKTSALITGAKREAAALSANPRMAGPGSELAQGIAKLKTAVSGQPPDALVDLGSLDKILLQMGAQNIRGALSGQRITNQEFMKMLTEGNPNSEMPLQTINKLLNYQGAQVDYDSRFNRTKMAALQRGANPMTVDSDIGAQADRGDYVESRAGVRPPTAGGKSSRASAPAQINTAADYAKLAPGAQYRDPQGNVRTKPSAQ